MGKFDKLLEDPHKTGVKNSHLAGLFFGYSHMIRFIYIGFCYWVSSRFIYEYNDSPKNTYIAI